MEKIDITDPRVTKAFNEWMRRFIEEPEKFEHDWQTVNQFLSQEAAAGEEPSYGESCVAFLSKLLAEIK